MSLVDPENYPYARILGIESSCDETAAAVIENGRMVLSNVVASQAEIHAKYGGVFPEVASRQHILTIYTIIDEAMKSSHLEFGDLDAIAVTQGPGLPGSLVVGINAAKGISMASGKPLIGINHLEAHIYSAWLHWPPKLVVDPDEAKPEPKFPLVVLIVSGGHTELVLMRDHLHYERLGGTRDDAAGEAFDKVARLLELGYPGGPAVQKSAHNGNPRAFKFPRAWLEDPWDFSFSGLKTAVLRQVEQLKASSGSFFPLLPVADLAASFQDAVVDVLVGKTLQAARQYEAAEILVAGGVSANEALRTAFAAQEEFCVHIPPLALCTDNAAMIAAAGYFRYINGQRDALNMDVRPNWPLSEL